MSRRFGVQLNGEREVFGALPVQGLLKQAPINRQQQVDLKKFVGNNVHQHLVDQENQDVPVLVMPKPAAESFAKDDSTISFDESLEDVESSEIEHSDCSIAPPKPFTSLDLFQDYSKDVLMYCLQIERCFMADPHYMTNKFEINGKMRAILVDWLVDVADEYNLQDETLFLAVQYVDRYLSRASITRSEFQLLGISALFIASKYEEIYPPELEEFAYTTDDSATKGQILAMEKNILKVLEFDVSSPTPFYFLKRYATDLVADKEEYFFAKYLCTLTLMDPTFLRYYPSEIALSCILLSFTNFNRDIPSEFIKSSLSYEHSLGEGKGDVPTLLKYRNSLLSQITKLHQMAPELSQQSIYRKYCSTKYFKVGKKVMT